MSTTTVAAIKNQMEAVLNALTPTYVQGVKFRRSPRDRDLMEWATDKNHSSTATRKYELRRVDSVIDPPFLSPEVVDRTEMLELVVAYYVKELHGTQDADDTEDVIRSDANMIWGALFAASNYIDGQNAAFVQIGELDRTDDKMWFQKFLITLRFYETRSPTT